MHVSMEKEDWQKITKWIGIAYLPIGLLVIVVFIIVEWQTMKIQDAEIETRAGGATTTLVR